MQQREFVSKWHRVEVGATRLFQRLRLPANQKYFLLTVTIAVACGLMAVSYHLLIQFISANLINRALALEGTARVVWTLIIPTAGGLAAGLLIYYFAPEARGSGIPQVKIAYTMDYGRVPMRVAAGKAVISALCVGSGASLGREGPTVQICAAISHIIARLFSIPRHKQMNQLPVGAAAAIAAAFNTPIAAVTFALEEIIGDLNQKLAASIVIAAVISSTIERWLLGAHPLFTGANVYALNHPAELLAYAALGITAGVVGTVFAKMVLWLRMTFRDRVHAAPWAKPAIGGLIIGAIGIWQPMSLGLGYDFLGKVLQGQDQLVLQAVLALMVAKILTSSFSYGSGMSGGVLGPSMFIGGMLGAATWHVLVLIEPEAAIARGAFALVGMGAVFAAVIRVPITSILLIFEMTYNYEIILPVMIANALAYTVASRLTPLSIYEAFLFQDGIHLTPAPKTDALARITAASVMTRDVVTLPDDITVAEAIDLVGRLDFDGYPVLRDGHMVGLITTGDLRRLEAEGRQQSLLADVMTMKVVHAHPDQTLDTVVLKLAQRELSQVPVVSRADDTKLLGIITLRDIARAQARLAATQYSLGPDDTIHPARPRPLGGDDSIRPSGPLS
ncbi:MAG TPA: chloride channel protein [Blastocatellia bacterium]|nr:chloride channel protein [Blastocatellia bacterium]